MKFLLKLFGIALLRKLKIKKFYKMAQWEASFYPTATIPSGKSRKIIIFFFLFFENEEGGTLYLYKKNRLLNQKRVITIEIWSLGGVAYDTQ